MKKVNSIIYNKLFLQAEEAKDRGLIKLSQAVLNAIGPEPEDKDEKYASDELEEDIYDSLWKMATYIIKYYDLKSVDSEKLGDLVESFSEQFIDEVKNVLNIEEKFGPNEPDLIGQKGK